MILNSLRRTDNLSVGFLVFHTKFSFKGGLYVCIERILVKVFKRSFNQLLGVYVFARA